VEVVSGLVQLDILRRARIGGPRWKGGQLSEEGKESDRIETHAIGEERWYSNEISKLPKIHDSETAASDDDS